MNIAVIGVGGTGSFATQFLSKTRHDITLVDGDIIEESNLNRQTLFTKKDVYKFKAIQAKKILNDKNITAIASHLTTENAGKLLKNADYILDCTDNWLARATINEYCLEKRKKWVYCGAIGDEAMISTIAGKPCFQCFANERPTESCSQARTTAQACAVAATIATQELLSLIKGEPKLAGKLFYMDTKTLATTIKPLKPKRNCPACVQHKKLDKKFSTMCGGKDFLFFNNKKLKKQIDVKKGDVHALKYKNAEILLFNDGRALVKNASYEKAVEANEFAQRKLDA